MSFILCIAVVICMIWLIRKHFEEKEVIRQYSAKYDKYSDLIIAYDKFQSATAENNLFIKYTLSGVQAVVDNIATNAGNDPILAPFFTPPTTVVGTTGHDTFPQLKSLLDTQIASLLGAPWVYPCRSFTRGVCAQGRSMKDSHRGLNISSDIFDRFLTVAIVPALKSAGVSDADIAAAAPALQAMKNDIISV